MDYTIVINNNDTEEEISVPGEIIKKINIINEKFSEFTCFTIKDCTLKTVKETLEVIKNDGSTVPNHNVAELYYQLMGENLPLNFRDMFYVYYEGHLILKYNPKTETLIVVADPILKLDKLYNIVRIMGSQGYPIFIKLAKISSYKEVEITDEFQENYNFVPGSSPIKISSIDYHWIPEKKDKNVTPRKFNENFANFLKSLEECHQEDNVVYVSNVYSVEELSGELKREIEYTFKPGVSDFIKMFYTYRTKMPPENLIDITRGKQIFKLDRREKMKLNRNFDFKSKVDEIKNGLCKSYLFIVEMGQRTNLILVNKDFERPNIQIISSLEEKSLQEDFLNYVGLFKVYLENEFDVEFEVYNQINTSSVFVDLDKETRQVMIYYLMLLIVLNIQKGWIDKTKGLIFGNLFFDFFSTDKIDEYLEVMRRLKNYL